MKDYLGYFWCVGTLFAVVFFYRRAGWVALIVTVSGLPFVIFSGAGPYTSIAFRAVALSAITALCVIGCIAVDARIRAKNSEDAIAKHPP